MSIDYAHTALAEQRRRHKAKTLASWCYTHGVDGRLLEEPPELRRAAARAAGVPPPHETASDVGETWALVGELLARRIIWDANHGISPPRAAACVACAIIVTACPRHLTVRCRVCRGLLHPLYLEEGHDTHPCCDPSLDETATAAPQAAPATIAAETLESVPASSGADATLY